MNTDFTSTSGHLKNMSFKLATKIFCFRIGARTIFKQLKSCCWLNALLSLPSLSQTSLSINFKGIGRDLTVLGAHLQNWVKKQASREVATKIARSVFYKQLKRLLLSRWRIDRCLIKKSNLSVLISSPT